MTKKKEEKKEDEKDIGITVKKDENFSEWYTQIVKKADLGDLRYNVKGFLVYRHWATRSIKKIYNLIEAILEKKGHEPIILPTLIPESNFNLEAEHVEGFVPEVFWVTEHGDGEKFEEKLALRPTSETAFYQMYSLWIRSYKDLPFKRYQSCSVFRYEGKATRPFFRAREFHWIEAHDVFATRKDAEKQVIEDMETTKEFMLESLAMPFIFFQRPQWDKFPGAENTYAADALMGSGKVIQLPSTHMLGQNFSKPFNVKFVDEDSKEQYAFITCYGPAVSRIYGAMIAFHGDDKGLVLPFDVAPRHIVIVPILFDKTRDNVLKKCNELKTKLEKEGYDVVLDDRDERPGWKFNEWEMRGVPIRIELGPKDLEKKSAIISVRTEEKKKTVKESDIIKEINNIAKNFTKNLKEKAEALFKDSIINAKTTEEVKKAIEGGKLVRCSFCSCDLKGADCAEIVEKEMAATVRGIRVDKKEKLDGKCVFCEKPAKEVVYIAKSY